MSWSEDEKDSFFKHLAIVAETLGEPMSPVRLAGYCAALEDFPLAAILFGMSQAVKTCRYFPKPVDIRELAEQSPARRQQVALERERFLAEHPPGLPKSDRRFQPRVVGQIEAHTSGLSDEERAAGIARLRTVVSELASKKAMR